MTEMNELQAILGIMILEVYPDRTKEIIKSLRIIRNNIIPVMRELNLEISEEEIMECISNSLGFIAQNATIKEIEDYE